MSSLSFTSPVLEPEFLPLGRFLCEVESEGREPIAVAVAREGGNVAVYEGKIGGSEETFARDCRYVERIVKFLLWAAGGYRVTVCGNSRVAAAVGAHYTPGGARDFDVRTMSGVYEQPFVFANVPYDERPVPRSSPRAIGGHTAGCRIGFDAGGSDMKVSAVIDGEVVFSQEVVWSPKTESDPAYHFRHIVSAMRLAKEHLPRVDAIGISSAGIYVDNHTRLASLFKEVSPADFDAQVRDIYARACEEVAPGVPFAVANDGDVSALAGAMELHEGRLVGLAMGTSEAVGYVDASGNITGQLNELAFAPIDVNPAASVDPWSGDAGVGATYLSQDGVVRLCPRAGIELPEGISPANALKQVQALAEEEDARALRIYESIGCYLAHAIGTYAHFYDIRHLMLLGRVSSGRGGEVLVETCRQVLSSDYPALPVDILLPSDRFRRVGQSIAAASLAQ